MNHTGHLTEEQFAECALTPDPASEAHLATCAPCRAELAAFAAAMNDFGMMATRWSEAQPRVSLRAVQQAKPHVLHHPAMRWALAGVLLVAVGVPVVLHGDRAPENANDASTTSQMPVVDDSQAQIDQDNQLMQSVNVALSAPEPPFLAEYGLQPETNRSPELRTQ